MALAGCCVLSLLLTVVRWWGPDLHAAVLVASFAPAALVGHLLLALGCGVLLRRHRRRVLVAGLVVGLVGAGVHAAWLAPGFVADPAPGSGDDLVVATLNLKVGAADTAAVARWVQQHDADVVVLTEVTSESHAALQADPRVGPPGSGPRPFRAGAPLPGAQGTVVLSRHPLGPETPLDLGNRGYRMRVDAPVPFTLTAAHAAYPLQALEPWRSDLRLLESDAEEVSGELGGRHVVVGDLNATLDHRALRDVLAVGLRDAAEQAGSGWQPTWPAPGVPTAWGVRLPGPVLALDHVLVSPGLVARSTSTQEVPGTDHLGLVAVLTTSEPGRRTE